MAISNVVLVTALFDIGRPNWKHHALPEDRYLWWFRNTLSLDANLVVFVDDHFYDRVQQIISEVGNPTKTRVIRYASVHHLPAYIRFNADLERLMFSDAFKAIIPFQVPEAVEPLYNVMMFNKIDFIKEAIISNKAHQANDYYWWVDAGGLREEISNYKGVKWPSVEKLDALPKDKCLFFNHHPKISIHDIRDHSLSQMRFIQGTAFGGRPATLSYLGQLVDDKVRECLRKGYIGSDEKVFDLVALDHPELFHYEVSTWREYFNRYR
jgi:hypothetical protein